MTKKEYTELLKSPKWALKRAIIFKRDKYVCVFCGSNKNIQAHHKYYIKNRKPWEYRNSALITLCKECHESQHENKHISEFVLKIGKTSKSNKSKNNRRIEKMYSTMSKRDVKLQKRINQLKHKGII